MESEASRRRKPIPGPKAEGFQNFEQLPVAVGSRKALQKKTRIERKPVDLAQAADQPHELPFSERSLPHLRASPGNRECNLCSKAVRTAMRHPTSD